METKKPEVSKTIQVEGWLTFSKTRLGRVTKNKPDVGRYEHAIKINLEVPASLFEEPQIVLNVSLEGVHDPSQRIEASAAVRNVLSGIPGVEVRIGSDDD